MCACMRACVLYIEKNEKGIYINICWRMEGECHEKGNLSVYWGRKHLAGQDNRSEIGMFLEQHLQNSAIPSIARGGVSLTLQLCFGCLWFSRSCLDLGRLSWLNFGCLLLRKYCNGATGQIFSDWLKFPPDGLLVPMPSFPVLLREFSATSTCILQQGLIVVLLVLFLSHSHIHTLLRANLVGREQGWKPGAMSVASCLLPLTG